MHDINEASFWERGYHDGFQHGRLAERVQAKKREEQVWAGPPPSPSRCWPWSHQWVVLEMETVPRSIRVCAKCFYLQAEVWNTWGDHRADGWRTIPSWIDFNPNHIKRVTSQHPAGVDWEGFRAGIWHRVREAQAVHAMECQMAGRLHR